LQQVVVNGRTLHLTPIQARKFAMYRRALSLSQRRRLLLGHH
jgi:hypothetical protein